VPRQSLGFELNSGVPFISQFSTLIRPKRTKHNTGTLFDEPDADPVESQM
jgi:hypothetical protein